MRTALRTALTVLVSAPAFAGFPSVPSSEAVSSPTGSVTRLAPVVVEASRLGKTALEMPQYVETVSAENVEASGAHDIVSALERNTGVFIRHVGGGNPALAQTAVRGYGENSFGRVLVALDGEQLNYPDMSVPNLARVPLGSVRRIEVLHGPQTVLHGGNASAGMINMLSDDPTLEPESSVAFSGGSYGAMGAHAATRGRDEASGLSWRADGDWNRSDGYRDHSGWESWTQSGAVRKDWENGSFARLSWFYDHSEWELPGALTKMQWKHDPRAASSPTDWYRHYAYGMNLSGKGVLNDENALEASLALSHRRAKAYYLYYGIDEDYDSDVYSLQFSPQWTCTAPVADFENVFMLGAGLRYDKLIGHVLYDSPYMSSYKNDQNRFTAGVFAQNEIFLREEFSITLGTRLERAMTENGTAYHGSRNDNLAAFEAAANWRPVEESKIFVKWSRFYRNPFFDDVPWYYGARGYLPDRILSPEKGYSVDFGGEWNPTSETSFGAAAFVSDTDDEIFYDSVRYSNVNSPDAVRRAGFESHAGWERDKTAGVMLRYLYTHAEFAEGDYDGNRVPLVPIHQVSLTGRVWLRDDLYVRGGYRYLSDQVSCSDFTGVYEKIPAFGLFSIGAQYEPEVSFLKGFTFSFDVENLFDKNYCDYSTYGSGYYPGAGRTYRFCVKYAF